MKRLTALLLCLLLLCGCGAPASRSSSPLFWQAEDESGHVLYLLGSIHAADESLYPLPGVITDAYESADALAVELDISRLTTDLSTQMAMLSALSYSDGSTIRDHVGEELYETMVALLEEYGLYTPLFDHYNEAYWMSLLENVSIELSGLSAEHGVDLYFTGRAHEEGKPIREVESFESQLALLNGVPGELQLMLLQSAAAPAASAMQLARLYEVYKAGDEAALTDLAYADNTEALLALDNGELLAEQYAAYVTAMYHDRNLTMTDTAEEYLRSGDTVFMAVGAAHMLGDTGIVAGLRARGYTVTQVCP